MLRVYLYVVVIVSLRMGINKVFPLSASIGLLMPSSSMYKLKDPDTLLLRSSFITMWPENQEEATIRTRQTIMHTWTNFHFCQCARWCSSYGRQRFPFLLWWCISVTQNDCTFHLRYNRIFCSKYDDFFITAVSPDKQTVQSFIP